jgi:hypothetical protein
VKLRLLRNKPSRLGKSSERKGIFIKLIRTELTVRNKLSIQILRKSKTYMSSMKRGSRRSKRSYKVLSRKRHYSNLNRINYQRVVEIQRRIKGHEERVSREIEESHKR